MTLYSDLSCTFNHLLFYVKPPYYNILNKIFAPDVNYIQEKSSPSHFSSETPQNVRRINSLK